MSVAFSYSSWLHPQIIESWLLLALAPLSAPPRPPGLLVDSAVLEDHLVQLFGFTDEETETQKGEEPGLAKDPWELVAQPEVKSRMSDAQARGFSQSPSRLWPSSSKSPKATDPKSSGAWNWGDSLSGFLGHHLPTSEGETGRCPYVESQEQGEGAPPRGPTPGSLRGQRAPAGGI